MRSVALALALLSGVVGAGFASGREIERFFAAHGSACGAAIAAAVGALAVLFARLPAQMARTGTRTLGALCRVRFGERLGRACGALFLLLSAITGGAMLAACAELAALLLPMRHAYALGMAVTLPLAAALACWGCGLSLIGGVLAALLPALLVALLRLPVGEACFLPAMTPDAPVRAMADGLCYGALNAAMLAGALPMLLPLSRAQRRRTIAWFTLFFTALLTLGALVCRHHRQSIAMQPLPFVWLSRSLGAGGFLWVGACLYAAALSTLVAMLNALMRSLPARGGLRAALASAVCLAFALIGFESIVRSAYPVLGAVCAALLALLCLPLPAQVDSPSSK